MIQVHKKLVQILSQMFEEKHCHFSWMVMDIYDDIQINDLKTLQKIDEWKYRTDKNQYNIYIYIRPDMINQKECSKIEKPLSWTISCNMIMNQMNQSYLILNQKTSKITCKAHFLCSSVWVMPVTVDIED